MKILSFIFIFALSLLMGEKESDSILPFLNQFNRPFCLIEFSPDRDSFSFNIARDFPSVVVFHKEPTFVYICEAKDDADNILLLTRPLNLELFTKITECEHFDVALFLHFFEKKQFQSLDYLSVALEMGWLNFIKISKDEGSWSLEAAKFLKAKGANSIWESKESALYFFIKPNNLIKRKFWVRPVKEPFYPVEVTYDTKFLIKPLEKEVKTRWDPGINLMTYKAMGGAYPKNSILKEELSLLRSVKTGDWMMNNIIIEGSSLKMIDLSDPRAGPIRRFGWRNYCSDARFNNHCKVIDTEDTTLVEEMLHKMVREGGSIDLLKKGK
jgi:hypothetical protein